MNKGILVIDMPSSCDGCPLFCSHYSDMTCKANGRGIDYPYPKEVRQEWCPLKPNNGWISVKDALPEEYEDVLGYSQEGHIYICRLYESKIFGKVWQQWNGGDMRFDWIIAWQPLPAPYKKGE